jgi:hypothetical protein
MSDPTHEVKEGHPPTYTLLQLRFRGKGIARIVSRDEYNMLKKSGMLWEFYPDAPMEWPTGQKPPPACGEGSRMSDPTPQGDKIMNDPVVRELLLTIEYLRYLCEHAEGRTQTDSERLRRGSSVGLRMGHKHRGQITGHQSAEYWKEVWEVPESVGICRVCGLSIQSCGGKH